MNKIRFIQSYFHLFDFIFWIDDDAFFFDLDKRLETFLPKNDRFLSICSSPDYKSIHTFISSGQFFIRCNETGRSFIDQIECIDMSMVRDWWSDELGFFSNGDQDAMVYLLKNQPEFAKFERHPHRDFNSRIEDLESQQEVFILHFTGTVGKKASDYKQIQKQTGFGPSLLPREYRDRLNYQEPRTFVEKLRFRIIGR